MKKRLNIIAVMLMLVMMFSLTACQPSNTPTSSQTSSSSAKPPETAIDLSAVNSDGAKVKMSVLYEDRSTRMRFVSGTVAPYTSTVDGNTYRVNDFKPAWKALQEKQNMVIEDVTPEQASSVSGAYRNLQANNFNNVNILSGSVTDIVDEASSHGTFVNLTPYIEAGYMPYLKKFIEENELVRNTITSADGEIFYAPYFDGYDDIETMFILRKDWVEKLLDGEGPYDTTFTLNAFYQPFYKEVNTTFTAMKTATETQKVTLQYTSGQGIIDIQNKLTIKNGSTLTEALKTYIKEHYIDKGYIEKASDLFCGQNACYNADEMVALLRCVKTNPQYLAQKGTVYPFYPRNKDVNRCTAILQLAQLWGVRGYDSRNNYFYVNSQGYLADGRTSDDMMEALSFIRQLYQENLLIENYDKGLGDYIDYRSDLNSQNNGFMTYDYNQTTTIFNETLGDRIVGMNLTPILFPVADWDNKAEYLGDASKKLIPTDRGFPGYKVEGEVLYQYTESWRSIKTEAWTITSSTKNNLPTFKKCIELFDYMYSPEGQILMSYGPKEFLKVKDESINLNSLVNNINDADYEERLQALIEQKYETFDYYERKVPAISEACIAELKDKQVGGGNYTNYYRYYVGATLPIGYEKEQGMENQTVDAKGKIGLDYIVNAVEAKVLKHAQVNRGADGNMANSLVPTTFPLTDAQNSVIANKCTELGNKFNNTAADGYNEFHNYIKIGFDRTSGNVTTLTPAAFKDQINNQWGGMEFYLQYFEAYRRMYKLD